jgi:PAT family beta-lactamase induction signal transducer AmpG
VGPAEIGAFVGSFYLPWAFKWAYGPVVDVFASARLGRRRGWILGMQVMMVLTLLSTVMLDLPRQLGLFTVILLVHNVFSATQDVAIDALAVNTLQEHERATANGMMFAGASLGQAVGGSGALFVAAQFGFQSSFYFVCGAILLVTLFVVLPLKEAPDPAWEAKRGGGLHAALREMLSFVVNAFRSFVGTRGAFAGLGMALLPPGAMCLGLALQSNLAVELGLPDDQVAWLNLWSTVIGAAGCVVGGIISDRVDRRKALNVYILLMSVPVLVLAFILQREGWITADANKTGLHNPPCPSWWGLLGRHPVLPVLQRADVQHHQRHLHGRDQPGGGGHPVHGLHGHGQPGHLLQLDLARHRHRVLGLPDHHGDRRLLRPGLPAAAALHPPPPGDPEGFTDHLAPSAPASWPWAWP